MESRIRGAIYGIAAGDKNHGPIAMVICLLESLLKNRVFDQIDIFETYLDWFESKGSGYHDTVKFTFLY